MASIQKRGKTYQYTVSNMVNGQSSPIRKGGFRTKTEARVAATEIESQLAKGHNVIVKNISFDDYFKNWIELYKTPKVGTITLKHYEYSLKAVKEYFLKASIQSIQRQDYQKFLNWFGSNKAKETVAKVNAHIKSCVKDALEDQIIHIDFTRKTEITWTTPAKKSKEKHLDYSEAEKLLNTIWSKRDDGLGYSLLLLGLTSGMRFGELVGLTENDFDFVHCTININKTWGYKNSSINGFGETKTEKSNRIIKMNKKVMEYFKELFQNIPENSNNLLFFSPNSKFKVISNTNANKLLKKLLSELNIEPITVHGLRHTHASLLLYKKASIHYVSERLGHSDIETTLKEYTHVLKEIRMEDELLTVQTFESMLV